MNQELLLKTAFCCMACDGDIAPDEIRLLNDFVSDSRYFSELDVQTVINDYIIDINQSGSAFLAKYLNEVRDAQLNDTDAVQVLDIAMRIIEADNVVEYSEISFFKNIRNQLNISDDILYEQFPGKDDYLLPDIVAPKLNDWHGTFSSIKLN